MLNRLAQNANGDIYGDWHLIFEADEEKKNWKKLTNNELVHNSEFLYISKDYPNQIWTGGWTTLFSPYLAKSEDGGETWANLNEEVYFNADATIYAALVLPNNEQSVLIGISTITRSAIRKSDNGGETWKPVLDGYDILTLQNGLGNHGRVYASGQNDNKKLFVAMSEDFGESWETLEFEGSPEGLFTKELIITEIDGNETLFFGTNKGVYALIFED